MRLRVSGQQTGKKYDLRPVMDGNVGNLKLPSGNLLNDFVEGMCNRDLARVSKSRATLVDTLGEQAMVDAAATIAAFNAYPRMANATGIPLEDAKKEATLEMREELGLEKLNYN